MAAHSMCLLQHQILIVIVIIVLSSLIIIAFVLHLHLVKCACLLICLVHSYFKGIFRLQARVIPLLLGFNLFIFPPNQMPYMCSVVSHNMLKFNHIWKWNFWKGIYFFSHEDIIIYTFLSSYFIWCWKFLLLRELRNTINIYNFIK